MFKSMGGQNMAQASSFLGLDFGRAKIGLALADGETRLAFAFGALKNDRQFQAKLKKIILENQVGKIIVGKTKHEKDLQSSEDKIKFGKQLEETLGISVEFFDEMFTTKMAHENLKMHGGKNLAQFDDQEAARIILQGWLDKIQNNLTI
ncbi:MAG: Holliday junction resolvase RuvX [Candidatus Moranbacteria bacterium]|nr:Holliday junction resolvase RuvX [Candidatus Moranbacteria bacterium]